MGKKSHRAKARKTANDGMNRSVVTWITIKSEGEEICEDDPNSLEIGNCSTSAFFVEEFNVSSSSEKSSPEISNASMKYEPGTTTQDWRGPTVKMEKEMMAKNMSIAEKKGRRKGKSSLKVEYPPFYQTNIVTSTKYNLRPRRKTENWLARNTTKISEPDTVVPHTIATVKRPRGRPRKRLVRRPGHCACCTCTHSESPSPVRIHSVKTEKEKSGLVGSAKMLGSVVELVAPDDDDKKHVDVKGALPRGTIVPRQVKESRISLSKRDHDLPDKKVQPMEDVIESRHDSSQRIDLKGSETPVDGHQDSSESEASFHGFETPSVSHILPAKDSISTKKKAIAPSNAKSIYNYKGPLIILCKDDLGEETLKEFCLFCTNLHPNIKQHMIEEHPNQEQVAFVTSRPSKYQQRFWKLLSAWGNHAHNNMNALQKGIGFIIPSMLNSTRKQLYDMRLCSGCKTWLSTMSLYSHKKYCPAKQWETSFGEYLEARFQNGSDNSLDKNSKVHIVLASLYESTSQLMVGDELCMKYLAKISKSPNTTHKDVQLQASALANLIVALKKSYPKASNIKAAFDLNQIKILMTTLRVVATDKATMKFDLDQVLQLSTLVGELVAIAREVSEDEEVVKDLNELETLLKSERWLQTLTKPIK